MAFFCVGNFSSCSSSDDNDGEGQLDTPQYAADAAKYEITDESSEVKSIELTESGQYIVIMNNAGRNSKQAVGLHKIPATLTRAPSEYVGMYYGNYTKDANGYYILEDFGTVRINKDDNGSVASVTIHSNKSGNEWTCPARLYPKTNENNPLTDKICRTWNFKSVRYCVKLNGKTYLDYTASNYKDLAIKIKEWVKSLPDEEDGWTDEDEQEYNQMIEQADAYKLKQFIFSKSGTILIKRDGTESLGGIMVWRWASNNSNEIQTWFADFDYNGNGKPDENEWSHELFFGASSDVQVGGKTTATFNKQGQLVLEESEKESDEGESFEQIMTLTFDEAK